MILVSSVSVKIRPKDTAEEPNNHITEKATLNGPINVAKRQF